MRLTVGPLPAAVYWRRRAVVLAGLALIVLIVFYSCGGSGASTARPGGAGGTPAPGSSPHSASPTLLRPTTPTPRPTPTPTPFTLPSAGASVPCSDAEMVVTASATPAQVSQGNPVDVTIAIKNVSGRTCTRDIGADLQELMLMDGTKKIWSSDDCNPNRGSNVTSFAPSRQISYTLTWAGRRSRTGTGLVDCAAPAPEPQKVYQLVARLDQKLSEPFNIHIESPG